MNNQIGTYYHTYNLPIVSGQSLHDNTYVDHLFNGNGSAPAPHVQQQQQEQQEVEQVECQRRVECYFDNTRAYSLE